jgi:hypothetical protein
MNELLIKMGAAFKPTDEAISNTAAIQTFFISAPPFFSGRQDIAQPPTYHESTGSPSVELNLLRG